MERNKLIKVLDSIAERLALEQAQYTLLQMWPGSLSNNTGAEVAIEEAVFPR